MRRPTAASRSITAIATPIWWFGVYPSQDGSSSDVRFSSAGCPAKAALPDGLPRATLAAIDAGTLHVWNKNGASTFASSGAQVASAAFRSMVSKDRFIETEAAVKLVPTRQFCMSRSKPMNGVIYIVGLIVVVMAVLSLFGLR